jgi:hypothetical protein
MSISTVLLQPVSLRTIGGHTAMIDRIDLSNPFPLSGTHKSVGPMAPGRARWTLDGRCFRPASVLDIAPDGRAFAEIVQLAESYGLRVPVRSADEGDVRPAALLIA